jgi:predicted ATPase
LEGRIRLLVVDNCEHVLDAAAELIDAILTQSTTVRVLATSREGLAAAQEQVHPVRSLDVTAGLASAAVALFVERAQGIAPGFLMVEDDEAAAVTEICQRLDGIPLAIELAASRMASMTASEVRDRLDHRFRLLVGARRGLERHHTLRHAVAWSYDLLDDTEKALLDRCSVFAGGFDLQSACAVAGSDGLDEYTMLDLLDALVRKSLLAADRSSGRTRFSMLETIRQFAEEQLLARGEASEVRDAHARHFAGKESDVLALWDSPRQREAYEWVTVEMANLRTAFRWSADHGDLDVAATIATYVGLLAYMVENYEPIAWAEELIEPARAVDHPRLACLYGVAAQCYTSGRVDAAVRYGEAGTSVVASGRGELPFGFQGLLCSPYVYGGQFERAVEWCRSQIQSGRDTHTVTRMGLVTALAVAQRHEEAIEESEGLIEAAEATDNPYVLSLALIGVGVARTHADLVGALEASRRGLQIAKDSGNRGNETHLAGLLGRLEAEYGDSLGALEHVAMAIHNHHNSGNPTNLRTPMATLATVLDRMGRYEPAAIVAGFGFNPFAVASLPELGTAIAHLREVLGDQTYESLAHKGESMTPAAMVAYAYDQIDQLAQS